MSQTKNELQVPIAVVGVSALFPGSLDVTGFWHDILAGKDLMSDIPPDRWLIDDYYDPDPSKPNKIYAHRGAFLKDVAFDPMEWGMPPSNIPSTDTSQLLALIVARKVLEDAAGGDFENLDKDSISVILGIASATELVGQMVSSIQRPVWVRALRESGLAESEVQAACDKIASFYGTWQESTFPGLLGNVVAGRIANRLDLGGTNCVIDAACASSLAALSMAIQELSLGHSNLVITGGVDALNDTFMYMCFSKTPALSPTMDCRPFSDKADGTMLGEGLGMVALKRLEDAERDGDRIYAVIKGLGSSSDGKSKSVYAPVSKGQAKAVRRAYQSAGYGPGTVELVEAHGTATKAGDAAEFGGIKEAFGEAERTDPQWCALGSVKSQIGHTKAAAGSASLVKIVMALHHKTLPPTIKVENPNPALNIETSPFYLNTETRPWIRPSNHPRRGSVSSFGFGGSNFHVALEEYTGQGKQAWRLRTGESELFIFEAANPAELERILKARLELIKDRDSFLYHAHQSLEEYAQAAKVKKEGHRSEEAKSYRLALVARDETDFAAKAAQALKSIAANPDRALNLPTGVYYGKERINGEVAFLFPGQGSQYLNMGAGLARSFDWAREVWERSADFDRENAAGEDRLDHIVFPRPVFNDADRAKQSAELTDTSRAQPAIGTVSLSQLAILKQLGIDATHLGGHSFGELSALYAGEALSEAEFFKAARKRGELMKAAAEKPGAMTAVFYEREKLTALIEKEAPGITLANVNSPTQIVIAGEVPAIERAEAVLARENIEYRRLSVATAFHSPVVDSAAAPFGEFLAEIKFQKPVARVYSNTDAGEYKGESAEIQEKLAGQIGLPVLFADQIETMYAAGARIFIEVGPGSVLTKLTEEILQDREMLTVSLDVKKRDDLTALYNALGRLVVGGLDFDVRRLWQNYAAPTNPADVKKPKLSVQISGGNYQKPYPPPEGKRAMPAPNPERLATPAPQAPGVSAQLSSDNGLNGQKGSVKPIQPQPQTSTTSPMRTPMQNETQITSKPQAASAGAWMTAFQEIQKQTADAHSSYQRLMAESHQAYLSAAESAFTNLGALLNGTSAQPGQSQGPSQLPSSQAQPAPGQIPARTFSQTPVAEDSRAPVPAPAPASQAAPAAITENAPVVPAPVANAGMSIEELEALLLKVVAEKTGYPVEMLEMDMELEAGLGIDSIKRVQILSAMKAEAPNLPEVDAKHLGTLNTLGEIVNYMNQTASAGAPVAASGNTVSTEATAGSGMDMAELQSLLLKVVAEKTGYPVEMLEMDMELEAGLGIDSIKRVQILSAMKAEAPNLPEVDAKHLGTLNTLGEIVNYMNQSSPANAPAGAPAGASTGAGMEMAELQSLLLKVVAEKTGYPVEMLEMDMELEAGLGIDSIKRVQILSAMKAEAPSLPEVDAKHLGTLNTLGEIVNYMNQTDTGSGAGESSSLASGASGSKITAAPLAARYVLELSAAPAAGFAPRGLAGVEEILVTDDGRGVAAALVKELSERGVRAKVGDRLDTTQKGPRGIIALEGLGDISDVSRAVAVNRRVFEIARAVGENMLERGGLFITVQDTGGDFGIESGDLTRAYLGGLSGLVKTAAQEWRDATLRSIDLERNGRDPGELARILCDEIMSGGPALEVGLKADGRRLTPVSYAENCEVAPGGESSVDSNSVIVATGGGRGVTAHTLKYLANQYAPALVLLGRTELTPEPDNLAQAADDAALKAALLAEARVKGEKITPMELGKRVGAILAVREIRANIQAMEAVGAKVRYYATDVNNAEALNKTLEEARKEFGPITGIVHGAGVIADKFIHQKTDEMFDRVFNTKVTGLRTLLDSTGADPLKFICLFSSVAARTGNVGQCDYAMANEILNKVSAAVARTRPDCLVKSLNWGPWEGGMVTPELKARFMELGVPLVGLDQGAEMMAQELASVNRNQIEITLGGEPGTEALLPAGEKVVREMEIRVTTEDYDFLHSHSIKGVPVVPVVLVLEWFYRAAAALYPRLIATGCKDIKMLRGIRLPDFEKGGMSLNLKVTELDSNPVRLNCEIKGQDGTPYYSGTVSMDEPSRRPRPNPARPAPGPGGASPWKQEEIYGEQLFHGPEFQVIQSLQGFSHEEGSATLEGGRNLKWNDEGWKTDTGLLDGGMQLALLWTTHTLGKKNLPTSLGEFISYSDEVKVGSVRCVLRGAAQDGYHTRSDLVFIDESDEIVAEMRGVEMHVIDDPV